MKSVVFAAVSAAALSVGGSASASTIDFENFMEGDVLSNMGSVLFADGITGTVRARDVFSGPGDAQDVVVFDTTAGSISTGNDPDLTSPFTNSEDSTDVQDFGLALIIQEPQDGTQSGPATTGPDDIVVGRLVFDFDSAILVRGVSLLDVEEDTRVVVTQEASGNVFFDVTEDSDSDTGSNPNNNLFTFFDTSSTLATDRIIVRFSGSGALGSIDVNTVPLPASLPMLAFGLLGAGYVARRRQSK